MKEIQKTTDNDGLHVAYAYEDNASTIINKTIALTIRAQRKWCRIPITELAEHTGIRVPDLIAFEKNTKHPNKEQLYTIMDEISLRPMNLITVLLQALQADPDTRDMRDPMTVLEPYF